MEEIRAEIESLKEGKYRVQSILGAGGFGITYRCVNMDTGETCAIKEYMPEAIASRDPHSGDIMPYEDKRKAYLHGKKRFLEEADILMRMNHIPSVVHVWESFEENNTAYYVMEYLQGTTLKQVMRSMGGKLPYPVACEAVVKAGTALDTIHRQAGIFHRDISPENIMVMPNGEIKIIDFGSAKSMSVSENQRFSVVLKPGFAPPEQYASNLSQGSFTDVYAMAGTFYYAASGKMIPVAPDRLMGVTYERLDRLVPECTPEAAQAVERALNLDPKFRTQTMSEFIQGIMQGSSRAVAAVQAQAREESQTGGQGTSAAGGYGQTGAHVQGQPETDMYGQAGAVAGGSVTGGSGVSGGYSVTGGGAAGQGGVHMQNSMENMKTVQPDLEQEALLDPEAWIEVVKGACKGRIFPVKPNIPVTVGRSSKKSQYVLEGHPEVSGLHFQLMYAPQKNGFYVIDESVNGLYYKGFRLEKGKKYKVLPGDQIGIGSMQCVITVGAK